MKRIATLALACLFVAATVHAHDTWLIARTPHVQPGQEIALHLTSGMSFPAIEYGPRADRIARAGWRCDGQRGRINAFTEGDSALTITCPPLDEGLGVVWLTTREKGIDLSPDEVEHYLMEIGAPATVRAVWEADKSRPFHETYTKHAKAYVRVGDAAAAPDVLDPVGLPLELVPLSDPTRLKPGSTLDVRVLKKGRAISHLVVGAACADGQASLLNSDSEGLIRVPIHAPGWWLLRSTEIRARADGTWESDFTTVTFYVGGDS